MSTPPATAHRTGLLHPGQIPNLICVLRILLVWPIVRALLAGDYPLVLGLVVLAGFSDGLDGYLAKRFDWRTRLGGILDPLADKLLIVSVFITLSITGIVPYWLTGVVVARDLVIVVGGVAYQLLIGRVEPRPSRVSKFNTGAQLLYVLLAIGSHAFGRLPAITVTVAGAAVFVTCVVSGLDYVLAWSRKALAARRG